MLKIAKSHEWARLDDGIVSVGITPYAVEALGDVVYVELPAVGDTVTAGETFGEIESVKAASELFAPCDGEVLEVHADLEDDFDVLKADATGAGWMIKIKPDDPSQLDGLMTEAEYAEFVENEE
jgi:glycine cleavage system H protein